MGRGGGQPHSPRCLSAASLPVAPDICSRQECREGNQVTPRGQGHPMGTESSPQCNRGLYRLRQLGPPLSRTPHYQGKGAVGQPGAPAQGFGEGPTSNTSSSKRRAPKIVTPSVLTRGRGPRSSGSVARRWQSTSKETLVPSTANATRCHLRRRDSVAARGVGETPLSPNPGTHRPSARLTLRKTGYCSGAGCPSWSS